MRLYRIGLFTDTYLPGPNGVATSVYLLKRELRRMGHEAWVLAPEMPDADPHEEWVVRVPSVPYPFFENQRLAMPSSRYLPTEFEIFHTHTPLFIGIWGARLAYRNRLPHVSTFHTHLEKYAHYIPGVATLNKYVGIMQKVCQAFYNRADVVIAPTEPVKRLAESYEIEREIKVIPTGIDTDLLEAAPDPVPPWPSGKRRLLHVGRLGKEKSVDVVIRALAEIRRHVDAHLALVGMGPDQQELARLARQLGVEEHLTFVGPVPYERIGGYYRLAELFLFASETETQGLVLWEAQAVGLPVVAVGAAGTLQGVDDGKSGYLVPPGDYRTMAARALELLQDEALRQQFSKGAQRFADQRTARRVAEQIVAVYDEASRLVQVEPRRLSFPFPRFPQSGLTSSR
ncbi:MAG: glycosyltransferase family 4 protein [Meiothermus sp.]|uniref:glycosyltransferase family 4 protein n=1 Tax=Meiothermus sp. TaxID=1955249 RepID=UPI0025F10938|nr:glycosyltransferase family 4 protein [Meiothermus sp.]MCS7058461.1 glycosyltransferase family 4 protein [Meiothermus sp.]MCS7193405.1 glycosyltransferase family 4 protein [Meiothermus sp.]MCX7739786.1 glycosyltransferase family 4 protein [Meiothermus sp.]MDW8090918.1 glycosyltransferase family 4 protein [Meiothermus sp.]MDW8482057.1 glycosyltransferase family 4 protein [Meiothermus sp.]